MNIIISDFFSASCFKLKQTCQTRYTFDPNGSLVFHQCMIKWQNHFFLILEMVLNNADGNCNNTIEIGLNKPLNQYICIENVA